VLRTTAIKDYKGKMTEPFLFGVLNSRLDFHNYCSAEALAEAMDKGEEKEY